MHVKPQYLPSRRRATTEPMEPSMKIKPPVLALCLLPLLSAPSALDRAAASVSTLQAARATSKPPLACAPGLPVALWRSA